MKGAAAGLRARILLSSSSLFLGNIKRSADEQVASRSSYF